MLATAPTPNRLRTSVPANRTTLQTRVIDAAEQKVITELDARGPTPPKPVPAILAVLQSNPPGQPQFIRTASAPTELLRALEARGVEAYPAEMPDGSWRTLLILRGAGEVSA